MNNYYTKLNEAMADLIDSAEETKVVKEGLTDLNKNISKLNTTYSSLNNVYGSVITAMANVNKG
jgi:hypothetical protein